MNLTGAMAEGVTATDLVLRVTELLRAEKVVGKFVEFFGDGTARLSLPDRATLANMAPEYGATMGFCPVDEMTMAYMRQTGRSEEQVEMVTEYFKAQGMWGVPRVGEVDYSKVVDLDLGSIVPAVAGPKRPQDRIAVPDLKNTFGRLLEAPIAEGGFGLSADSRGQQVAVAASDGSGSLAIAAGDGDYARFGRHRGDHLLHQHFESQRHDRRRPCCEKGG